MIRIIGDTHGEAWRFNDAYMPGQSQWTAEDTLIVTGDFGMVFLGEEYRSVDGEHIEKEKLDALANKPYQILFVDGNHEGFDKLVQYPEESRFGGMVRRIRDNIFWLQRGYMYTIEDKTFFTMGGAYSIDKAFRQNYEECSGQKIWFEEELPQKADYDRAIATLRSADMKVDYIITHTAPRIIIPRVLGKAPDLHDLELTGFFDWIYYEVQFKKWFFGHFHMDMEVTDRMTACYQQIYEL